MINYFTFFFLGTHSAVYSTEILNPETCHASTKGGVWIKGLSTAPTIKALTEPNLSGLTSFNYLFVFLTTNVFI